MSMHFTVDRTSVIPIYQQIRNWMTSQITTGQWQPNVKLPSEVELAETLGVSRGSLRKTIGLLISEGLLVQVHGKGTFVSPNIFEQSWAGQLSTVSDELRIKGVPFSTETLTKKILPAPEKVAARLDLPTGESMFYLKRLRRVDGKPLLLAESYFAASRFSQLMDADFNANPLMETVERLYGVSPHWADYTIAVVRAGADIAKYLEINVGNPVLFHDVVHFDESNGKIDYMRGYFHADRFRLKTIVRRSDENYFSLLDDGPEPRSRIE